MARKGVIALMACVFALCLALVGCGGSNDSGGNSANNKAAFIGTWDLVEMNQGGEVTDSDELETLKALGLEVFVNFNDDGTMVLALFGEPLEGTWEATSATAGTIDMQGQSVSMEIADGKLTFEQGDSSLMFEKGEAKEPPTSSSDVSASASAESEASESTEAESESAAAESESAAAESEASESTEAESESAAAESESASAAEQASESSSSASAEAVDETADSEGSSSSAEGSSSSAAA